MLGSSENTKKYKPLHLFKANIEDQKDAFFLITNSDDEFWMKQDPTDWEKIIRGIDFGFPDKRFDVGFADGAKTYYFNGKNFNQLYIPSGVKKNEYPYISGANCNEVRLEEIPLSKEKLAQIGIINKVELDLEGIPEASDTLDETEKALNKKLPENSKLSARKKLTNLFTDDPSPSSGVVSKDLEDSKSETLSASEKLTTGLSN